MRPERRRWSHAPCQDRAAGRLKLRQGSTKTGRRAAVFPAHFTGRSSAHLCPGARQALETTAVALISGPSACNRQVCSSCSDAPHPWGY